MHCTLRPQLLTHAILAACLATPALAQPNTTATEPKPPPEMRQLSVFFGTWTYEMDTHATPLWPAMKSTGTDVTRPLLDGFAVQAEFHDRTATGEARFHELNWLDPRTHRIAYTYLGNDGYVETGSYVFDKSGDTWSWVGTFHVNGTPWAARGKGVLAANRQSFTQSGEVSPDGVIWYPAFTKRAKRISDSTAPQSQDPQMPLSPSIPSSITLTP